MSNTKKFCSDQEELRKKRNEYRKKNREKRNESRKKNYQQTAKYMRRIWSDEEDKLVLEHSITDRELSQKIERSVEAIQVRRTRLKNLL